MYSETRTNKEEIIQNLCKQYGFPCAGIRFEEHKLPSKEDRRILNEILNESLQLETVVSIPAPQSHKRRLYKISESKIIDIMNASLVAQTNTEPTLKSDGILTDDGYEAVSKCLGLVPSTNHDTLRSGLHTFFYINKEPPFKVFDVRWNKQCQLQQS